jgi:hypothetical protein
LITIAGASSPPYGEDLHSGNGSITIAGASSPPCGEDLHGGNGLITIVGASSPPYGEDLHSGNGSLSYGIRFSNGLIITGLIGHFNPHLQFFRCSFV